MTKYREDIQNKLAPYTESSTGQLSQDMQLLFNRLQKDMTDAKERSTAYVRELKSLIDQNGDDARNRMRTYTSKLKKRLDKDTEEIRKWVRPGIFHSENTCEDQNLKVSLIFSTIAVYMGEIQSRASQNLDSMKTQFDPYIRETSEVANQKLADLSIMLSSQAGNLGKQLESQAEDLKTQLEVTVQELRATLEGKIDELKQMFSPYAEQIREHFEGVADKFKEPVSN